MNEIGITRVITIAVMVVLIVVGVGIVAATYTVAPNPADWLAAAGLHLGAAITAAVLAALFVQLLIGPRLAALESQQEQQMRVVVAAEMGSQLQRFMQVNALARLREAESPKTRQIVVDEMRTYDLFRGAHLNGLVLTGLDLGGADLRGASLIGANLSGCNLSDADLREANLGGASLRQTHLTMADFRGAALNDVDLSGAQFAGPEQLRETATLEGAVLPDGTELPRRSTMAGSQPGPGDNAWRSVFEAWYTTQMRRINAGHSMDEMAVNFSDE